MKGATDMGRGKDILSKLDEIIDRLVLIESTQKEITGKLLTENEELKERLSELVVPIQVTNSKFRNKAGLLDYQHYLSHKTRETEDES
jgi:hypothetical protein